MENRKIVIDNRLDRQIVELSRLVEVAKEIDNAMHRDATAAKAVMELISEIMYKYSGIYAELNLLVSKGEI